MSDNEIDLEIALRKLHELALEDGDLGYEYWGTSKNPRSWHDSDMPHRTVHA